MNPLPLDLLGASSIACARHREALAELAERAEPSLAGAEALAHLDRCRDCAAILGDLTLTVVALRRMGSESEGGTAWFAWRPSADDHAVDEALDRTWSRLRDRVERSRKAAREQAWRWRANFGGLLASALVVAALVGPATLHVGSAATLAPVTGTDLDAVSAQIEADYVLGAHAAPAAADATTDLTDGPAGVRRYPDDLRPARKEVAPARAPVRSPDAR
ncbi:MAG TPA: hypothetical protein VGI98_04805 [Candidatus Limnocylindrales bacterium]